MGSVLTNLFAVDVANDGYGFLQLCFLGAVYGYILCFGSNMIKDGSELLLLIPSLAGVVGSIVLPVLGAVPDGAIVLFSGLGPDAQEQINVGIGALAGSTIMLLTIPWFLSIWGGRVDLDTEGNANYVRPPGASGWSKLANSKAIAGTGINCGGAIKYSSKVMLVTTIPFFIIQIPAWFGNCADTAEEKRCETPAVAGLVGALFASALFCFYLWDQARIADVDEVKEDKIDQLRAQAIKKGSLSLRGLFPEKVMDNQGIVTLSADNKRFQSFLKPFFRRFDVDNSGAIEKDEFALLIDSLGEKLSKRETEDLMKVMDKDGNGEIDFKEFCEAMAELLGKNETIMSPVAKKEDGSLQKSDRQETSASAAGDDDDDEEEEPEVPEDLADLSPKQQQRRILLRSCWQMGVGVLLVVVFSDPMVDILSGLGKFFHIPAFYVAFVLAPLASNASELIAAFAYAKKKTEKTITISFSSLLGAACMNNSFCLAIFLFLVYFKNLSWIFTAETASILLVQLVMFVFAQMRVHRTWYGFVVLALFPISIAFVVALEAAGLD